MSISPISSISNNVYIPSISGDNKELSQQLKSLLSEYNLTPTGDSEADIQRLRQAIILQEAQRRQEEQESLKNDANKPWYEIMWELGLHPTDSVQEDYDDIMDELEMRINSSEDEQEYYKYANMYELVEEYFNEYSQGTSFSFSNKFDSTMIGASLIANMNIASMNLR